MTRKRHGTAASRRAIVAGVAVVLAAACGPEAGGPPTIVLDRTSCTQCGMLISDLTFAAAYRPAAGGEARPFDDIACLLAALAREPAGSATRLWFRDARTAAWVDGGQAVFVEAGGFRTPMGGGLVAVADPAEAERMARAAGGRVVPSFAALLDARSSGGAP